MVKQTTQDKIIAGRHRGGCVCGKIRYTIESVPLRITICHCSWCQRRTGSAFGVELVFENEQISFDSESPSVYRHHSEKSGRWLDQHFCNTCGSNIGLSMEAVTSIQSISVGSLDDQKWAALNDLTVRHVFTGTARAWSDIPKEVEQFEEHFRP